jgi:hypothetical protein
MAAEANFSTEVFLHSLYRRTLPEDDQVVLKTLDRLCKKLDVVRTLRAFYTKDLARTAHPVVDVSPEYLSLAAAILLSAAHRHRDLKFLNSALKLLDTKTIQQMVELKNWAALLVVELVI